MGIGLLISVVLLGMLASEDQRYVLWFGIAAAILAPTGLATITYVFRSNDLEILRELSRVPEIETLILKAKTHEEKIHLLEQERDQLLATVQMEAKQESLLNQKKTLEQEEIRILNDLKVVDQELENISHKIEASPSADAMKQLREKLRAIQCGDIVIKIGNRYTTVDRDLVLSLPFGGILWSYLRRINKNYYYLIIGCIVHIHSSEHYTLFAYMKPPENIDNPSKKDWAYRTIRGGLSAIPIAGGPLAEIFTSILEEPIQKRRLEWMRAVARTNDQPVKRIGRNSDNREVPRDKAPANLHR